MSQRRLQNSKLLGRDGLGLKSSILLLLLLLLSLLHLDIIETVAGMGGLVL